MEFLPAAFYALNFYKQFIIYRVVPSTTRPGKTDKLPIDKTTQRTCNAHDPQSWLSADEAIAALHLLGAGHGIGFVFTGADPFWFLDIDNCVIDGQWSPLAVDLLTRLAGAAVEVSLSGCGLHIIGSGQLPQHSCRNAEHHIELYTSGRFVALTGIHAIGDAGFTPAGIQDIATTYFRPIAGGNVTPIGDILQQWERLVAGGVRPDYHCSSDDGELLNRMLQSSSARSMFGSAASFRDLWDVNEGVLCKMFPADIGYNESDADASLAQHLCFWTGCDAERIRRFMMQSGLNRDKYQRPDYLPRTILAACGRQNEVLTDRIKRVEVNTVAVSSQEIPMGQPRTGTQFLNVTEQIEHFKGCVYVADENKIFVPRGLLYKREVFNAVFGGYTMPVDTTNTKTSKNAWDVFTESQALRSPKVDTTCFKPDLPCGSMVNRDETSMVNIYWPVPTIRTYCDVSPFLRHIYKLWPDHRDAAIVISYMAALVQHVGVKFQWCPLIQGVEGNGKSMLSRCIAFAVGDRYVHYPKAAEIASKFNDWLYGKVFISVEDIYVTDGRMEIFEALKPMISQDRQEVEPKGGAKVTRDICANFIINTNHKDGLRKTRNDRRICPLYTAQQAVSDLHRDGLDGDYFRGMFGWLGDEGYAGVNHFLRNFPIPDEFNPATLCKRAPVTTSTEMAIGLSSGRLEQEIQEAIDSGRPGFRGGWLSSAALDQLFETIRTGNRMAPNKKHELVTNMGFFCHPILPNGRVTCIVLPDGTRPRLYVQAGHPSLLLNTPLEVSKRYEHDQK